MIRSKRMKFVGVLLVACLLLLSACSSSTSSPTSAKQASNNNGSPSSSTESQQSSASKSGNSSDSNSSTPKVTQVTFWENWNTGPSGDSIKQSVAKFNAEHPNIHVTAVYAPSDGSNDGITSKLLTAVAAGNPPDVFLATRGGQAEYKDAVTQLDDLAKKDGITESNFYPWAWEESTYDGHLYGLPYDGTARVLYYNKDQFKEAGLDPNNPPKTIKELEDDAAKLTVASGGRVTRYGFIPWYAQGWLYSWGWAFGGQFEDPKTGLVTANDPKIVAALQWMADFGKKYGVDKINSFTNSAGQGAQDPFLSGQLSMEVSGNWTLGDLKKYAPNLHYGLTPVPSPDGNHLSTFVGGRFLIIPKGAKHVQAAWEFIKWMCTSEEGQSFKKITREFAAVPAVNEKIYKDNADEQVFLKVLAHGNHRPVNPATSMLWDELAKAPDLVMHGQGTAKQVLDDITNKVNKEIETKKAQK